MLFSSTMNPIPSVSPAGAPGPSDLVIDPAAVTWQGHMADDVAATDGPKPMAMLIATPQEIVLSGTRGTYRLPRSEVLGIGRGGFYPWFFGAIRLKHKVAKFPRTLQFKPMDGGWRTVRDRLRELGYPTA